MDCSSTAMRINVRPASAIDWGVVGSVAVFDDGIRFWGNYVRAEGIFQGKFTVYGQHRTEFRKLVNLLCATLRKKIPGVCHLTNFLINIKTDFGQHVP
jgi:hypothetical protein